MNRPALTFLAAFCVTLIIYGTISAPGLGLIDSGELTTVSQTLGIAHPTGYPLYTILGRVWLIISPLAPDRGMVVFSALCGAAAVAVLALAAQTILNSVRGSLSATWRAIFSVVAACGFAISPAGWNSILYAEVYPLTWLIAALILWFAAKILLQGLPPTVNARYALLLLYLCGLGLGNHLTIVWYAPLAIVILWKLMRNSGQPLRSLAISLISILFGSLTLLFLPIRSVLNPLLDWGNAETISNFYRHISAWQYRIWMFQGSFDSFVEKFLSFFMRIPQDIGWATAVLAVLGLWITLRRRSLFGSLMLVVWLIGTAYNMNYDIPDISSYFLVFYCPLFVLAMMGAGHVLHVIRYRSWSRLRESIALALLTLSIPVAAALADGHVRLRKSYDFPRRFVEEVFATLPDSALVFHGDWDIHSPYLYYRHVENLRSDLVLLDIGLMQRSWYIEQERRNHPDVFRGSERQTNDFLRAVSGFENGKSYDARSLEAAFVEMHNSIIRQQLPCRPVYIRDVEELHHPDIGAPFTKSPGGYFLRIAPSGVEKEPVFQAERLLAKAPAFATRERRLIASAAHSAVRQASHARMMNDTARVTEALSVALMLNGDDPRVLAQTQRIRESLPVRQP